MLACSRSKDTFTSRTYHEMVSRFNVLFNGKQAFEKAVDNLSQQHQDNFDKILPVFRYGDASMVGTIKPQMDKAIEKSIKAIKRHSMMIKGEQRNDFIDDAYLLMGKARFFNREYVEALETLNFVIQKFPKSESADEARLWAAKTETAMGNYLTAKEHFEEIYRKTDLDKELRALTYASYAQLEIDRGNETAAFQLLSQAVDRTSSKEHKVRWLYIMGQLQSKLGNDYEASNLFLKVIKKGPPYQLLFNAQLNRARTYDTDLQDPEQVYDELEDMLADDKNYDNRDQIYYVMAEVAERMDEEEKMLEYLKKSVRASTNNPDQKGLSYLKIAEYNFDEREYPTAAAYYDSSFSSLTQGHPRYEEVKTKNESLEDLVKNLAIISTQDSLQKLASLSEKDLQRKIRDIIEEEEEAKRMAELEANNPFNDGGQSPAAGGFSGGGWYFYNTPVRAAGIREFISTWGNRKLEDNWRRKDKALVAGFNDNSGTGTEEEGQEADRGGIQKKVDEYIAKVPRTPEELEASKQKVVQAHLAISAIYRNELKDLEAAEAELKSLLKRYNNFSEEGKAWYALYRININLDDQPDAELYKNKILTELPQSEFAALINGQQIDDSSNSAVAKSFYQKTYGSYNEGLYKRCLTMADSGLTAFASTRQAPQFMLLKAYSQAQMGNYNSFEETLNGVLSNYPNTDQSARAKEILDKIKKEEQEAKQKEVASTGGKADAATNKYSGNATEEQKYVVVVPNRKGLVNQVNIKMNDFNAKFFKNLSLNLKSIYISAEEQMVMISGLPNQRKAFQYFNLLNQRGMINEAIGTTDPKHFVISNSDFTELYRDKDFDGYLKYFKENLKNKANN